MPPAATLSPKLDELVELLDRNAPPYDLDDIRRILLSLNDLTPDDFADHLCFDCDRYQRNYLKQTPAYDLILCCWMPGQHSSIHDHKGSACGFRVLSGHGVETTFDLDSEGAAVPTSAKPLPKSYVCVAECDDIHVVSNPAMTDVNLVTLHLYAPAMPKMNEYELAKGHEERWGRLRAEAASG